MQSHSSHHPSLPVVHSGKPKTGFWILNAELGQPAANNRALGSAVRTASSHGLQESEWPQAFTPKLKVHLERRAGPPLADIPNLIWMYTICIQRFCNKSAGGELRKGGKSSR
jgi:hypothetical protein